METSNLNANELFSNGKEPNESVEMLPKTSSLSNETSSHITTVICTKCKNEESTTMGVESIANDEVNFHSCLTTNVTTTDAQIATELKLPDSSLDSPSTNTSSNNLNRIEIIMGSLMHSAECTTPGCAYENCSRMKRWAEHARKCSNRQSKPCNFCRQFIALCIYHAKSCEKLDCKVAFCAALKVKLKEEKQLRSKVELSKEFITLNLKIMNHKFNLDKQTQTTSTSNDDEDACYFEIDSLDQIIEAHQQSVSERMQDLREKITRNIIQIEFKQKQRSELVKFIYQTCITQPNKSTMQASSFASLVVVLFRKENEIFNRSLNFSEYLISITELAYQLYVEMRRNLRVKLHQNAETQVDTQLIDINQRIKQSRSIDDVDPITHEDNTNDEYLPLVKKIKTDELIK